MTLPAFAVAVILVGDRYALQHRDDRPDITWPGRWSLFGGSIEPGETPHAAMVRELEEELTLSATDCRLWWSTDEYRDSLDRRRTMFVFEVDLTDVWDRHELREGQGDGVFDAEALPEPMTPTARAIIAHHRATVTRRE